MSASLSSMDRVQAALEAAGHDINLLEMPTSTRTAQEAADSIGCEVAQIVKSLIFRGKTSGEAVLVLASGVNHVDTALVSVLIGEEIGRADADFVRAKTGFAIGGVAPVGHLSRPVTIIDQNLLQFGTVWAAAGKPNAVFPINPAELENLTGGTVAKVV